MRGFKLITGSEKKAEEFRAMFPDMAIETEAVAVDEVQSFDLEEIAMKKARALYDILKTPVVVDDTGFFLEHWKGLPGPFIKYFEELFPRDSLARFLGDADNRKGYAKTCIAYCGGEIAFTACGEVHGTIATEARGPEGGFGFDYVFIPDGYDQTFAELGLAVKNTLSHRSRALAAFRETYEKVVGRERGASA